MQILRISTHWDLYALCAVLGAGVVFGCSAYRPEPLTSERVAQSLATPDPNSMRLAASRLKHPMVRAFDIDLSNGVSPDEAGVLAVVANPDLRAERDRRAIAVAQVLQAGLLPNPQLAAGIDQPVGGPDHFTAYNVGANWDVTSLIGRKERRHATQAEAASVELDIAWKEWQTAEAAKTAAYDALALTAQLADLREVERQLVENRDLLRRAVERHEKTLTDLAASEAAADDARQAVVAAAGDLRRAAMVLNRAIGFPPNAELPLRPTTLPSSLTPPESEQLLHDLEIRRLDLLALKKGYESQDATLRAAILAQFPKINVGLNTARDTSDVRTVGFGATIDLPLFDRNQGVIANETATRQKLFDEYVSRVFAGRSDIATAIAGIDSLNGQIAAAEAALPALQNLVRTYQQAENRGDVDAFSLYSSQNALLQKKVDLSKLKQQLIQNWVALEVAAGRYLPMEAAAMHPATAPAPDGRK